MHETKWICFIPVSTHSEHSRCASMHLRGAAIVFLGTSSGSKERLIRFDERCVHAWASMSPAMRQLWSCSSCLWCHLLNDEVGRSLSVPRLPSPLYTQSELALLPPKLYYDCMSQLISMSVKIWSSEFIMIEVDWAIMPGLVIRWVC